MPGPARWRILGEPDLAELDAFVEGCGASRVFQGSGLFQAYAGCPSAEPFAFVAKDQSEDIVASVTGVRFREVRLLGRWASHATIRHGPVAAPADGADDEWGGLLAHIDSRFRGDVLYLRLYPLAELGAGQKRILNQLGYLREPWLNFEVELGRPLDDIWRQLAKGRKSNIKKALRSDLQVVELTDPSDARHVHALLKATHRKVRFPLESEAFFENVLRSLVPRGLAKVLMATHDGAGVATIVEGVCGDRVYHWFAGSVQDRDVLRHCPNDLLMWHAIEWAHANGLRIYDLGGAGQPGDKAGFIAFKKQFGGRQTDFGRYTRVYRPMVTRVAEGAYGFLRRVTHLSRG